MKLAGIIIGSLLTVIGMLLCMLAISIAGPSPSFVGISWLTLITGVVTLFATLVLCKD